MRFSWSGERERSSLPRYGEMLRFGSIGDATERWPPYSSANPQVIALIFVVLILFCVLLSLVYVFEAFGFDLKKIKKKIEFWYVAYA